jgi:hypothetical protein
MFDIKEVAAAPLQMAQVFFQGGTIKFTNAEGEVETRTFSFGDVRFIPRGTVDTEETIDGGRHVLLRSS